MRISGFSSLFLAIAVFSAHLSEGLKTLRSLRKERKNQKSSLIGKERLTRHFGAHLTWWAMFSRKCHFSPQFYTKNSPKFTATFLVAVNLFFSSLVLFFFCRFSLFFFFPLLNLRMLRSSGAQPHESYPRRQTHPCARNHNSPEYLVPTTVDAEINRLGN